MKTTNVLEFGSERVRAAGDPRDSLGVSFVRYRPYTFDDFKTRDDRTPRPTRFKTPTVKTRVSFDRAKSKRVIFETDPRSDVRRS